MLAAHLEQIVRERAPARRREGVDLCVAMGILWFFWRRLRKRCADLQISPFGSLLFHMSRFSSLVHYFFIHYCTVIP